jgi:hypothetical protein
VKNYSVIKSSDLTDSVKVFSNLNKKDVLNPGARASRLQKIAQRSKNSLFYSYLARLPRACRQDACAPGVTLAFLITVRFTSAAGRQAKRFLPVLHSI